MDHDPSLSEPLAKNSIWLDFAPDASFPTLNEDQAVDVAIVGGGITGLTTAQLLREKGFSVAVLESFQVGENTTGNSTGNLNVPTKKLLSLMRKKNDQETLEKIIHARQLACDLIEANIDRYGIDCDYIKTSLNLYSAIEEEVSTIDAEFESSKKLQLAAAKNQNISKLKFPIKAMLSIKNQAQFNPLKYTKALAKIIKTQGVKIFENTVVKELLSRGEHKLIKTNKGNIVAKYIVHATHTPKGFNFTQALMGPYREYGVACKISNNWLPPGIFWGYYKPNETISTRIYEQDEETYLLVVGEAHKVGQVEHNETNLQDLEDFARAYFTVQKVTHRWGAQHYRPADYVPYIGESFESNSFIATGFATDGLVYGTVAAIVIRDLICNNKNNFGEVFNPKRINIIKAAPQFLKETINVATQYIKDYAGRGDAKAFDEILPGTGKTITRDGQKLAVYKHEDNSVTLCSAICPHLGCIVNFNSAEKSWDCPCHGSRFSLEGKVLEGPTCKDLHSAELKRKELPQ